MAERIQREHQRPTPPIPTKGHRPHDNHRKRPPQHPTQPQRTTKQDPRLPDTIREVRRVRCSDRLNPPSRSLGATRRPPCATSGSPRAPGSSARRPGCRYRLRPDARVCATSLRGYPSQQRHGRSAARSPSQGGRLARSTPVDTSSLLACSKALLSRGRNHGTGPPSKPAWLTSTFPLVCGLPAWMRVWRTFSAWSVVVKSPLNSLPLSLSIRSSCQPAAFSSRATRLARTLVCRAVGLPCLQITSSAQA